MHSPQSVDSVGVINIDLLSRLKMLLYYLYVCCLVLTRIEIKVAAETTTTSTTTEKPPSNDEDLLNIHQKLLEVQDDVISITKSIGQGENLESIIEKFNITQESFQQIKHEISKHLDQFNVCSASALAMLNNQNDAASAQLENLHISIKEFAKKRLPETKPDIKTPPHQNSNSQDVLQIVEELYSSSSDNIELLANLTESDIELVYNIALSKFESMSEKNKGDPYKWIRMVKIIQAGVLNQNLVDLETKSSAQIVVNQLYKQIKDFTLNALSEAAIKGAFERNGEIDNLTMTVYLFDPTLSESIMEEFVDTIFDEVSLKKILDTILSHRFIQQRIKGISVLFGKMKDSLQTNDDITMKIASALYKIHSYDEYKLLSRSMQTAVETTIDMLPTCARNLFFLPSVCLWNRANEEYLTAGNSTLKNDDKRRNIFTSEDVLPGSDWLVESIGDNVLFSSRTYTNEYLYAAYFNLNDDLRYLFSWIPGNNTDKQSEWKIHLNDDYCTIQSTSYYEYVMSSNYKSLEGVDKNLNFVFTWSPKTQNDQHQFHWQIRKCD